MSFSFEFLDYAKQKHWIMFDIVDERLLKDWQTHWPTDRFEWERKKEKKLYEMNRNETKLIMKISSLYTILIYEEWI